MPLLSRKEAGLEVIPILFWGNNNHVGRVPRANDDGAWNAPYGISNISGSIKNNRQIHFMQDFGAQYPKAKCDANYDVTSKSMFGKCAAAGQSANFTAHLL